jgi:hypothetical protein
MYTRLAEITFADVMSLQEEVCNEKYFDYLTPEKKSTLAVS